MFKPATIKKLTVLLLGMFFVATTPHSSYAQVDIIPAQSAEDKAMLDVGETHPPIKLTPDKSELIRLDKKAESVLIGNPQHVSVLAENTKTLVLVPAQPGATYITVLDSDSNIIMSRHVIVAAPKERYVRVRNTCRGDDDSCVPTRVYFCPDLCHEVNIAQETSESEEDETSVNSAEQLAGENGPQTQNNNGGPPPQ